MEAGLPIRSGLLRLCTAVCAGCKVQSREQPSGTMWYWHFVTAALLVLFPPKFVSLCFVRKACPLSLLSYEKNVAASCRWMAILNVYRIVIQSATAWSAFQSMPSTRPKQSTEKLIYMWSNLYHTRGILQVLRTSHHWLRMNSQLVSGLVYSSTTTTITTTTVLRPKTLKF